MNNFFQFFNLKKIKCLAFVFSFCLISNASSAQQTVDLIVYGDHLVTMDGDNRIIPNGAVAINNNLIVAVGSQAEVDSLYSSNKIINGKSRILMPGLINGHTHSAMSLFRGMADDLELMPWLNNFIFPMEARFVDREFIKIGSKLACYEMIRGGTTTFVDMYFYPDVISKQIVKCGLRAIIGAPSIDFPSPGFKGWDDSFAASVNYVKKWQGKNERITPAFAPHAPYTVSAEHIKQLAKAAKQFNAPVSIHLAETQSELKIIKEKYNVTPIEMMAAQGLFNDITVIGAHMVHPSPSDIQLLAKKKVGAIHNPTSNLKLAAGIAPVARMLKAGVNVGLGTDGAASNNDLDLWEEIRLAALIHKVEDNDPTSIPALTALKMATSIGAKAIGMGEITGQLKVGLRADMIQVSIDDLRVLPIYNIISHLVYVADSNDVVSTIVSGNVLMQNRQVLTINENKLREQVTKKSEQIADALKASTN